MSVFELRAQELSKAYKSWDFYYDQKTDRVAHIIRHQNDSLSVPDSLMSAYTRLFWDFDTVRTVPPYYDSLPNGYFITWPEVYTDGKFYIKLYRNYLLAGLYHSNPNPNALFYLQPISRAQFNKMTDLIHTGKIDNLIQKERRFLNGKMLIDLKLNERAMGLYTYKDCYPDDSSQNVGSKSSVLHFFPDDSTADIQFINGLTGFINTMNLYLKKKEKLILPDVNKLGYAYQLIEGIYFNFPLYYDLD